MIHYGDDYMTTIIAFAVSLLISVGAFAVVLLSRRTRIPHGWLIAGAAACWLAFVVLNISDWPLETLAPFWRDHAIISGTISAVLLLAIGFLAFEVYDRQQQEQMDRAIVAAGRAGVVDHLIEIDVALSLAAAGSQAHTAEMWPTWREPGRPLRWLRVGRDRLNTTDGVPSGEDPRAMPLPTSISNDEWRREIVDQSLRRLMAGMRDWANLLGRSRDGQQDLADLGEVRLRLLELHAALARGDAGGAGRILAACQRSVRTMGWRFEERSFETDEPRRYRSELVDPAWGDRTGAGVSGRTP